MKNYNDEYFLAFHNDEPKQIYIKMHQKSDGRRINGTRLMPDAPIFFESAFQERDARLNIQRIKTDIMFGKGSFIVNNSIRQELIKHDLQGMQLYPAVLVEADGNWNETFWYLNLWEKLDCWDRKKSIVRRLKPGMEEKETVIKQYSLDSEVLDKIPEEKRLIFKMGGEANGEIFIHKKLVDFFTSNNHTGIRFFKVSEFKSGMQL